MFEVVIHENLGEILLEKLAVPQFLAVHAVSVCGFQEVLFAAFIAGFKAAIQTLEVASQDCCDGSAANIANVFFFLDSFFGYDIHSTYVV